MARKRKLPEGMTQRGKIYYCGFRAGGRLVRKRLSSDFKTACGLLKELKARAERADFGLTDNDYPWVDLKAEFLNWARQARRKAVFDTYAADLAKVEEYCPIRSIRQLDHKHVVGFRDWRLSHGVTPCTVNRQVGTVNNMLNKGVKWGLIGDNPIAGIERLPHDEPVKQRRALTLAEVESLFDASPPHLLPAWRMFMTTGIRKSELVNMRFDDVDFERKSVTVRAGTAKSHKAREIPLDDEMLATIARLRDQAKDRQPVKGLTPYLTKRQKMHFSRDHVFVTKANTPCRNNLLKHFYSICQRAGIEGAEQNGSVDIHSLRVTFTTLTLEHGASPKAIQAILGHATLGMTMNIYAKATERAKRDAIGVLPFAHASQPEHVIPMRSVPTMCASNSEGANKPRKTGVSRQGA